MARVPYAEPISAESVDLADRIRVARGSLLALYRVLLHSPPIASGWLALLSAVRDQSSLSPQLRELLIMHVALLNDAAYEWSQHRDLALRAGLTTRQLESLGEWRLHSSLFTELQTAALEYCEAMTKCVQVPQSVYDRLRTMLEPRQLVELTVTVAAYNMVSRVLEALSIEPDER